ncbi:hypothetical protein GIB67_034593 [Kingdonia uniflora]|uniref:Pentatricopeptide repeat-containing protein n=1 Tax=Kingdonia uniflora TaxID=39325 RepID=A0A7J7MXF9_9MAGN|nr:hypothetical protein GIB67_034593 [Kingdonia uniflora]
MFPFRCHGNRNRNRLSSTSVITKSVSCRSFASEQTRPLQEQPTTTTTARSQISGSPNARTIAQLIDKQPWSSDLETTLVASFTSPLPNATLLHLLNLIKTTYKATQFLLWAQSRALAPNNDQTYYQLLEIFGRKGNFNAARNLVLSIEKKSGGTVKLQDKFFNSLIRNYGNAGLIQESIKVFIMMKSIGVAPSVITFNSLLTVLVRRGRITMAKKLFDEMLTMYGISPDVFTFNILIRGFCMNSMVRDGFRFFKDMSRYECTPDVITYNTLVDGLCRAGKVRIAHNVVKGMSKKGLDLRPNVVTYTTLIRGYCEKHCIGDALDVFDEMIACGLKPNRITHNTLIQGLCEAQKFDKITEVLEGMIKGGEFYPDTCTFNTLMNAHCNAGKLDEALIVFDKMVCLKIIPDSASYSILIRNLCEKKEFEKAEKLFDELYEKGILVRDVGCTPLVAAYNLMFEYLCSEGRTDKAERLFKQLLRRGTQDPPSFKTLIIGHCREGEFKRGYDLLVLMLRRDFVPDTEIYESLIEGFLKKKEPCFAHKTLEKMLKSSYQVKTSMFHYILADLLEESYAREAASLVMLMLERRIRQNINLSTNTITLLFKTGIRDTALEIMRLLYEKGFSIKMEEPINHLLQNENFLEAREVLLFNLEKNQTVDIEMYSDCITGLCKIKRAAEAFGLYYELIERGNKQGLSCLRDLKNSLEDEGRSNEAAFISKKMERMNQENE